jgi:putative transcriptional regulator
MPIAVDIDVMLARRKMSVGELADRVGITPANLAVLKNGRAKAVRFTTLAALCEVLQCQPGDLLRWEADSPPQTGSGAGPAATAVAAVGGAAFPPRPEDRVPTPQKR